MKIDKIQGVSLRYLAMQIAPIQNDFIYSNCVNINMKIFCIINNITSDWNIF